MSEVIPETKDISDFTDDELMGMNTAPEIDAGEGTGSDGEDDSAEGQSFEDTLDADREDTTKEEKGDAVGDEPQEPNGSGDVPAPVAKPVETPASPEGAAGAEGEEAVTEDAPNYEELYKKVLAPFRANGREFTPSSPEEAVQLMQMGANYTKKMQALQPKMKLIRMLEKNELLDEDKISFLIDLNKKDPAAVAKLVKDSEIDPMDIDVSGEQAYKPGNYRVSDDEMAFSETLSSVMSTATGKETVSVINGSWDEASKQAVFKEPAILTLIDEQRANGLYARISAEVDRQQTLGRLTNIPFIEAYKRAGTELNNAGLLSRTPSLQPPAVNTGDTDAAKVTGRRDASPSKQKDKVVNADAARKVSPTPSTGKATAKQTVDPFDLTDEQIMAMKTLQV